MEKRSKQYLDLANLDGQYRVASTAPFHPREMQGQFRNRLYRGTYQHVEFLGATVGAP